MAKIAPRLMREAASYVSLRTESIATASIPAAGKHGYTAARHFSRRARSDGEGLRNGRDSLLLPRGKMVQLPSLVPLIRGRSMSGQTIQTQEREVLT